MAEEPVLALDGLSRVGPPHPDPLPLGERGKIVGCFARVPTRGEGGDRRVLHWEFTLPLDDGGGLGWGC